MNNTENQENLPKEQAESQNVIENNPSDRKPDEQAQNETGFDGTTNSISENHQDSDQYKIAIEDTMVGYDGDDSDLNLDTGD